MLPAATVPEADPLELIQFAADAGMSGVGLDAAAAIETGASAILGAATAAGIVVNHLENVPWSMVKNDAERDGLVDFAAAVGSSYLVVAMGKDATVDVHDGSGPLKQLGEKCLAVGVEMAIEHGPETFQPTVSAAVDLVRALGHGVVVVDLYLHHRMGGETLDLLALQPEAVGFVRIGDGRESTNRSAARVGLDSRTDRRMPGSGEFPLLEMLRAMPEEAPVSVHVTSERLAERLTPPNRAIWAAKSTRLMTGIPRPPAASDA